MNKLKIVLNIVSLVLLIDFISFGSWIVSNQMPNDSFYFGMITSNFISLII